VSGDAAPRLSPKMATITPIRLRLSNGTMMYQPAPCAFHSPATFMRSMKGCCVRQRDSNLLRVRLRRFPKRLWRDSSGVGPRREPMPDAEEEAASEAALRH
jgi:hypothetical protein